MATRTRSDTLDVDFSLESWRDYALLVGAVILAGVALLAVVVAPLYVFATAAIAFGVGHPLLFALGCYSVLVVVLYGWVV